MSAYVHIYINMSIHFLILLFHQFISQVILILVVICVYILHNIIDYTFYEQLISLILVGVT